MTAHGIRSHTWLRVLREVAIACAAFIAYFGARGITEGDAQRARCNADTIIEIERALGILWELAMQRAISDHGVLITLANWVYIWGHWPVIASVGAWLLYQRPMTYAIIRNAFLMSGSIGLLIFMLFPVAPPRLVDLGVIDTVTLHSHAYRVLQPPAFVNQYAAMPSLHFGWDLLIGIALVKESGRVLVRLFGGIMPGLMLLAVILTANHYVLDVVAGGVVALVGLAFAGYIHHLRADAPPSRPAHRPLRT